MAISIAGCSAAPTGEPVAADGAASAVDAESTAATSSDLRTPGCGPRFVSVGGDASPGNTCQSIAQPCRSIGQAIAAACAGDSVFVGPGTFTENVVVDKALTIAGLGERTVVVPATSSPNPCTDSSLCGGAASSVFVVRASHVTVAALTVDGDNPALTSGTAVGGVDVDARNGIITDDGPTIDALVVVGVTVRNVYLRGLDAASGGTFRFEANRVSNVSNDPQAVAIFNSNGAGTIADNIVSGAGAGIASNFSRGVTFARNRVTGSGAGIHTDNAGAASGSTADAIVDNVVSACTADGFGAFVFVPTLPVTVRGNLITGCSVGLAAFGEGADVQSRFVANRIDGAGATGEAGAVGVYVTTSQVGFGSNDVHVAVERNRIAHTAQGVFVEQEAGFTASVDIGCNAICGVSGVVTESQATNVHDNALSSSDLGVDASGLGTTSLTAPNDWWGCAAGPGSPGCSGASANVDATPVAVSPPACTLAALL